MSWRTAVAVASITLLASWPSGQAPAAMFDVAVDDARPLAKVLDEVEGRFGWTVTYEDPPYQNANEIEDVTERVRRDGKTHPRVLGPRGGAFHFSYPLYPATATDPERLLGALLSRYEASGNPGFFRALTEGRTFHVVPFKIVDAFGVVVDRGSLLDTVISIEPGEMNLVQVVGSIAAAVSVRTDTRVIVGATPLNLLLRVRVRVNAREESARTLLLRYLSKADRQVSWRLFYDPGIKLYALNLHIVGA